MDNEGLLYHAQHCWISYNNMMF